MVPGFSRNVKSVFAGIERNKFCGSKAGVSAKEVSGRYTLKPPGGDEFERTGPVGSAPPLPGAKKPKASLLRGERATLSAE